MCKVDSRYEHLFNHWEESPEIIFKKLCEDASAHTTKPPAKWSLNRAKICTVWIERLDVMMSRRDVIVLKWNSTTYEMMTQQSASKLQSDNESNDQTWRHYYPLIPPTPSRGSMGQDDKGQNRIWRKCERNTRGRSLNDVLYDRPLLLAILLGILFRFRVGKYVAISDIEKAFLTG